MPARKLAVSSTDLAAARHRPLPAGTVHGANLLRRSTYASEQQLGRRLGSLLLILINPNPYQTESLSNRELTTAVSYSQVPERLSTSDGTAMATSLDG